MDELKKMLADLQKSSEEFKAAQAESIKSGDDANKEALDKMHTALMLKFEEADAKQKEVDAEKADAEKKADKRLENIEAAINRKGDLGADTEEAKKDNEVFDNFMRKQRSNAVSCKLGTTEHIKALKNGGFQFKEMSVGVDPDGGYLVRPVYADKIIKRIFETSPMRRVASSMTIGTESVKFTIDDDEANAGWVGEQEGRTETDSPQIGELEIFTKELYAMPIVTQKLLDDSVWNMEAYLSDKVANKMSRTENTAFISGDGIEKPRGILTYDAWAVAGAYERGKVEQINMGLAAAVTADGFVDIQTSLIEDYQANAVWMMNRSTYGKARKLKDGQGQYLLSPGFSAEGKPTMFLLGHEVIFAADMPVVAANALAVAYGDFNMGYTVVDRRGITILRDPFTTKGKVKFYHTKRVGGDVTNYQSFKIGKIAA